MRAGLLRPSWYGVFRSDVGFVAPMFILLGAVRMVGLAGNQINVVVLGFLIMWTLPFIFLRGRGRKRIGISSPASWGWSLASFAVGALAAGAIYALGYLINGTGIENWGMTVVHEFGAEEEATIPVVFAVITFLSMLFSPIGEELFFRGMMHEVLADRLPRRGHAGSWSSLAFATMHIPHHDVVFSGRAFLSILTPVLL